MPDLPWLPAAGLFVLVVVLTAVYSGNRREGRPHVAPAGRRQGRG
jgi:hypothetical protein